ncbi:NUDIX hydrolase [Paenibacillus sp. ACRRX]|uniref:NUDIX hydrolase n=1 Tax=Paenibacillus sp. ACRRX TaxID=2918206 RepID=UPI001EF5F571|nr:NUDIX hydrolase [Paenibacillus sp. ACRRX]MCG7409655.1 NUDIX hydrolase [Paenibacillus sp. ACRRX]
MKRVNVVYALITDESKTKILMVKNKDNGGWTLPGGGVEDMESLEAAAVREAKEETGYDIRVFGIVAVNEAKIARNHEHALFITFRGEIIGGVETVVRPEEIVEIQWVAIQEADKLLPYYKEGLYGLISQEREITYSDQGVV